MYLCQILHPLFKMVPMHEVEWYLPPTLYPKQEFASQYPGWPAGPVVPGFPGLPGVPGLPGRPGGPWLPVRPSPGKP